MQAIVLSAITGYFIGSIPFSYLVGKKLTNLDLRHHGSGNLGATNVIRIAGKKAGILAFILDILKGIVSYLIGYYLAGINGAALASTLAVLGHSYSIFTKFRGGKGVATSFGIIIMFSPITAICMTILQLTVIKITHFMSLASIISAISIPVFAKLFELPNQFLYFGLFIAVFVTYKHKENIKRLLNGTENKFKFK